MNIRMKLFYALVAVIAADLAYVSQKASAADSDEAPESAPTTGKRRKRVDVDQLRKQYWRDGAEYDVVQDRLYSKKNKLEIEAFGGFISTDPFLSVQKVGGSIGYHFSEYISVAALGWKSFSGPSEAMRVLEQDVGSTANVNHPNYYVGGEGVASVVYGKLSLLGKAILYYDLHFLAGGGVTGTQNGNYFTIHGGVGQQIYLNKDFALRMDYRLMYYNEDILSNTTGLFNSRSNISNVISLGVSAFIF